MAPDKSAVGDKAGSVSSNPVFHQRACDIALTFQDNRAPSVGGKEYQEVWIRGGGTRFGI
ncbi:hypothetical protein SBA2_50002 [Acidobacteriia bacterium SbA2]|nr:hypothetical protein SBA2_50002 [Acidobacteriia bacterium SbA2]